MSYAASQAVSVRFAKFRNGGQIQDILLAELPGYGTLNQRVGSSILPHPPQFPITFGGTLSPHIVHSWTLKTGDLSPLVRVLKWINKKPFTFEMVYFIPTKGIGIKDTIRNVFSRPDLINFPLLIRSIDQLSPSPVRIVLRRFPSHFVPISGIQSEDFLVDEGLVIWSSYGEIIEVEESTYKKFPEKDISIEEFDQA